MPGAKADVVASLKVPPERLKSCANIFTVSGGGHRRSLRDGELGTLLNINYRFRPGGSGEGMMRISRLKFLVLIVMSLVGIAASSFVFYIYDTLHQQLPMCVSSQKIFGIAINCNVVLGSKYNTVLGVNLDLLAIGYFFVNLGLVFAIAFGSTSLFGKAFKVLFVWRFLGLIIVPYLMTIEFAILKTICVYCTIMHGCILIDFAIVTYFLFYKDITHPEGEAVDDPGMGLESTSADGVGPVQRGTLACFRALRDLTANAFFVRLLPDRAEHKQS